MTEYECRNPKCHMHRFMSSKTMYECPVCHDKGGDEDGYELELMNISEEKEYQAAWNEEIAREAAAMYGPQAYLDHHNVSFGEPECFSCGIEIDTREGMYCEWCD